MKINVSVIIVNYKVKEKLFECLKSIYASKPQTSFEIIIVDNDEIETIEKDLKNKFPKVVYLKSIKNLGYGAGNNLGAKKAKGNFLFFLNPDTIVEKDTIDNLYKSFKKNKNAGIISPLILDEKGETFKKQGYKEFTPLNAIFSFSFLGKIFKNQSVFEYYSVNDYKRKSVREVEAIYGAALMIPKVIFNKLNGFDENFFLYFEENDISKRARDLGYTLYIDSNSRIFHKVGESTKRLDSVETIFSKSRFYYLKKHYGLARALIVDFFLKINKTSIFLAFILFTAFILRIYNLPNGMIFIGDQGWFYLSARDLLIKGNVPLVGITSSHTWLHQGPLWTYMLSVFLAIFKFNPLAGGYLTTLFGVLTVILMYIVGKDLFSKKVGLVASFLYCFSPLVVFYDRMPFDPTPIPFFTLLYLFAFVKWVKGNTKYFPWILFLLAVLYNLELSTFILFFPFVLTLFFGLFRKKGWVTKLWNKKNLVYSFLALFIPMIPVLIYDTSHGFAQTVVFFGWTVYKPLSFIVKHSSGNFSANFYNVLNFLAVNIQKLVLQVNIVVALILFFSGFGSLIFITLKRQQKVETALLLFLLIISVLGILVNQTPSDAYLFILFPFIILSISLFFNLLFELKYIKYFVILFIGLTALSNLFSIYKNDNKTDLKNRMEAVNKIILLSENKEYNLIGKGEGSQFRSFTMNYEYLLWWKGHAPSTSFQKIKIVVWERKDGVIVYKL